MNLSRCSSIIVAVLGVVSLVFGVLFITQASSTEKVIAAEIQPLKIAEVDAKYEAVKLKQVALATAEEPNIQAGKAAPSATYIYLTAQKTSLGLAKANIGVAGFVRTSGILGIIVGLGLVLGGMVLFKKSPRTAKKTTA
jgi:hypothetical protein